MRNSILFIVVVFVLHSCASKQWVLTNSSTSKIPIDKGTDNIADKAMASFVRDYKENLDSEMNQVIGQSSSVMVAGRPESLLSNWTSDIYLQAGSSYLKVPVDMAVVNMGGLRASLPEGNLTVGNIFQLMPFENELVILWLKGSEIDKLLDIFAREGGQAIAGAKMDIKEGKAINGLIQGKPIQKEKLYSIVTNDFLAGGNDRMTPLTSAEKRVDTGMKIRDIIMEYVIRETRDGHKIESKLDGRIRLL